MRYLAIGDIHGCFKALTTLAAFVPFEPDDIIIGLGDYVDRGPNSRAVLDWLIERQRTGKLVALRGNHELLMLQARNSHQAFQRWQNHGGAATLASYSGVEGSGSLADIPDSHWEFLEQTRPWFEIPTHFFVHAGADATVPLAKQTDEVLYWEDFGTQPAHESGKIMVCGHTAQRHGLPRNFGYAVCIDTWVYGKGWLTCLEPELDVFWQANQQGQTRLKFLDDL